MRSISFSVIISILCFLISVFEISQNLKVIPQKTNVTYLNKKYIEWANFYVKRYGRKSDYYMNIEGYKYHTWGNNFTIHLVFNEFLHNEYRRSFMEMHFKLCEFINNNVFIGAMIATLKIKCPVVEKDIHLMNMTIPTKDFKYKIPFEKSRVDAIITITNTDERVAEGQIYVIFKE